MTDSVHNYFASMTNDLANRIASTNEKELNTLHILANMNAFRDETISLADKQKLLLDVAPRMKNNYENIAFYNKDGDAITADGRTINFAARPYFSEAIAGKDYISDPTFSTVTNSVLQHYSVPVYNDNGTPIGAIVLVVNGNALYNTIKDIDLGDGMKPVIFNIKTRATISSGDDDLQNQSAEIDTSTSLGAFENRLFTGETDQEEFWDAATNKRLIAAYQPIPGTSWSVFAAAPYNLYFKDIKTLQLFLSIAMVCSIIVSILICGILIKHMVKPLVTVKNSITSIAKGNADLTQRIPGATNDEIGDVVSGFNGFIEKLQSIVKNLMSSQ